MSPNWQEIVANLLSSGLGRAELAEQIQCSKSMVDQLARGDRGERLSYSIGTKLVSLHLARCPVSSSALTE
ncbi:hypothetical protein [Deefgea rivuli]|uniref:hypothetical protein n=1 Tax=Deefgea rivuli TaxID=400948 RepID=UPI00056A205A|nr:hypothetical protein [Deefgea rivuli]